MWSVPYYTFVGVFIVACDTFSGDLQRYEEFRMLKVGDVIPSFISISNTGKEVTPTTPSGKFFIHFINDQVLGTCLDMECGDDAKIVLEKQGHLHASGDGKLAALFGLKRVPSKSWKLDTSLMVVTDHKGQILAFYESTQLKDIKKVVEELQF